MPQYLAPYIGSGSYAKRDAFRPRGSDQPGWSAIDLRPDASKLDGYALLSVRVDDPDPLLNKLGDETIEPYGASGKALFSALNIEDAKDTKTVLRDIFFQPKRTQLCNPVQWNWKGEREIWLAGQRLWLQRGGPLDPSSIDPSDNFNRADETPLAGNWTIVPSSGGTFNLSSNQVVKFGGGDCVYYWIADTPPNDQWSEIEYVSGFPDFGPATRCSTSALTCYFSSLLSPGDYDLCKFVAGSFSIVSGGTDPATTAGDVFRLEAEGSTVRLKKNTTTTLATSTDTSIAGGRWGLAFMWQDGIVADNWQAGSFAAGGPPRSYGFVLG